MRCYYKLNLIDRIVGMLIMPSTVYLTDISYLFLGKMPDRYNKLVKNIAQDT